MNRLLAAWCLGSAATLTPLIAVAQVEVTIDLAQENEGGSSSIPRPAAKDLTLAVINRLPGSAYRYTIEIAVEKIPLAPLVLPTMTAPVPGKTETSRNLRPGNRVEEVCPVPVAAKLDSTVKNLKNAESEKIIPAAIAAAAKLIDDPTETSGCLTAGPAIEALKKLIALTIWSQRLPPAAPDEDYVVRITRKDTKDNKSVTWVKRLTGKARGEWVTTYGFTFLTTWTAPSVTYTAEELPEDGQFRIQEDRQEDQLRFVPTVFFTWQPSAPNVSENASLGLSGGLGFDLTSPVALLGASFVWNRNVTAHIGLAAARVDRLAKRYRIGDVVGTNLTPEQLRYSPYKINPFISISFNLSSNPFGGSPESSKASEGEEKPSPAPGATPPPAPTPAPTPAPAPAPAPAPTPTPAPAPAPDAEPAPQPPPPN